MVAGPRNQVRSTALDNHAARARPSDVSFERIRIVVESRWGHHQAADPPPGQGIAAGQSTDSTVCRVIVSASMVMGRVDGRRPQMMRKRWAASELAQNWCAHLSVELRGGVGLVEQMTWPQRDTIPFVLWNFAGLYGPPSPARPRADLKAPRQAGQDRRGRRRLGSRERSQSRLDKFGTPAHSLRLWERAG